MIKLISVFLASDGGRRDDGRAACACLVRAEGRLYKIVALLPESSVARSELAGLALGVCLLELVGGPETKIDWSTDSLVVLEGLQSGLTRWKANGWRRNKGQKLSDIDLWKIVDASAAFVTGTHAPDSSDILRCHRACDWIIDKGEKFIVENRTGFLESNAHKDLKNAWFLIDGRELFNNTSRSNLLGKLSEVLVEFNY